MRARGTGEILKGEAMVSPTPVRDATLTLNDPRFHYRDWGN